MGSARSLWTAACLMLAGCGSAFDTLDRSGNLQSGSASQIESGCGPLVTHRGNTIDVLPSGGEDTRNLQCALGIARGDTVRLAAGTFRIAQIVSVGFVGNIHGAGAAATVLTNVDRPLQVTPVDFNLAPPSAAHPWPTLLAFVGGDFTY